MKLIDKDTLVAEIERIKKEECPIDTYEGRIKLFYFERFLSFIKNLEMKEVDLDAEIMKYQREIYDRDTTVRDVAKHFFELGTEVSNKAQKRE